MSRTCLLLLLLLAFEGKGQLRGKYCYTYTLETECLNFLNDSVLERECENFEHVKQSKSIMWYTVEGNMLRFKSIRTKPFLQNTEVVEIDDVPELEISKSPSVKDSLSVCVKVFDFKTKEELKNLDCSMTLFQNGKRIATAKSPRNSAIVPCIKMKGQLDSLRLNIYGFEYYRANNIEIKSGNSYSINAFLKPMQLESIHPVLIIPKTFVYEVGDIKREYIELKGEHSPDSYWEGVHQKVKYLRVK